MVLKKMLVDDEAFVLSGSPPIRGQRPKVWIRSGYPALRNLLSGDGHKIRVVGLDATGGAIKTPLFETELLGDGHTKRGLCVRLESALHSEIVRLDGTSDQNVSVSTAMLDLVPLLRRLHGLGYTVEELRRLVVGSLRVNLGEDELAALLFG